MIVRRCWVFSLLCCLCILPGLSGQSLKAYKASTVLPVSKAPLTDACVLIRDGRIVDVVAADQVPDVAEVIDLGDVVLFPGLVDGGSQLGLRRQMRDRTRSFKCDESVKDAFDPLETDITAAVNAGVLTVHVVSSEYTASSGVTGVAHLADSRFATWLSSRPITQITMAQDRLPGDLAPTSPTGVFEALSEWGLKKRDISGLSKDSTLAVAVSNGAEATLASRLGSCGFAPPILRARGASAKTPRDWAGQVSGVILDPVLPGARDHELTASARLRQAGLELGFASLAPEGAWQSLRLSAAVAVRHGLSRSDAWRALTLGPAIMLGVADEVGSLESGRRASMVAFDRDPTDPRARVIFVIVDGKVRLDRRTKEVER